MCTLLLLLQKEITALLRGHLNDRVTKGLFLGPKASISSGS